MPTSRKTLSLALALFYLAVAAALVGALPQNRHLYDFATFLAAGRAVAERADPYGMAALVDYARAEQIVYSVPPNLNPPLSLLAFQALAALDPIQAYRAWLAVSLACYVGSLLLLFRAYPPGTRLWAWCLLLAGVWYTLVMGQVYLLLGLLAALAWLALRRGAGVPAGLLLGLLVAIKPNFVLWPIFLLLAGCWLPALLAAVSALLLSLVPALLYGPAVYGAWLAALASDPGILLLAHNASLPALAARWGLPALGWPLALALAGGSAWLVWRGRPAALDASALGLAVSLLASPVTWIGYTVMLVPVFVARPWSRPLLAAACLLLVPEPLLWQAAQQSAWLLRLTGSIYPLALLLLWAGLVLPALPLARRAAPDAAAA